MFSCINIQEESRIESISKNWLTLSKVDELRNLTKSHDLVCPKCRDSVIYRNGEVNRAHFAHRASEDDRECSLEKERRTSIESEAVGMIYTALENHSRYDVQVDVMLEGADHTIDLLISQNGKVLCAYWVFEKGKREDTIDKLIEPLRAKGIPWQIIFTGDSIQEVGKNLKMSSSVKKQIRYSAKYDLEEIDIEDEDEYGHLQYFDRNSSQFKVYRGLNRSQYSFVREFNLSSLIIAENGDLICSDDLDHAEQAKEWIDEREKANKRSRRFEHLKKTNTWGSNRSYKRDTVCLDQMSGFGGKKRSCTYCGKSFTEYAAIEGPWCVCYGCEPKHR